MVHSSLYSLNDISSVMDNMYKTHPCLDMISNFFIKAWKLVSFHLNSKCCLRSLDVL
uniref:Uncharacterized protein n=1 Tax=Arundo donax TaxID=35708 RepID=A0A0A8ZX56_ARUDO